MTPPSPLRTTMVPLGFYVRQRPRTVAAIAFGGLTAVVTHFAWFPDARMHGAAPALTIAAGVVHALAGAVTGPRLVDRTRTQTSLEACLLGAGTSLLAVVLLAPLFALWVSATNAAPTSPLLIPSLGDLDRSVLVSGRWVGSPLGVGWHRLGTLSSGSLASCRLTC
ncbi:MAG TPA: hypothetical protein VGI41_09470, partial [Candidatus Udaeobacter sp.]